jgi:SAM-dependent methyltransferase
VRAGNRGHLGISLKNYLVLLLAACAAVEEQPWLVRYEPSPPQVVSAMLELAQVTQKDVVYDLGCGDGRIVIEAAKRYGARGVCIDIDPRRIAEARANAAEAGVSDRIEFREEDLTRSDLRGATVVTLFLSYDLNLALRPKLERELPAGTPVVSHWHRMGDWPPEKIVHVQGAERGNQVFLFRTGGSKKL